MRNSLKVSVRQKVGFRFIISSMFLLSVLFGIFSVVFQMAPVKKTQASSANETINAGAYIINMGITPQTASNALRPYGMIYDLINNYDIPVKWVINPSKAKDGIDFTYNSVNYKGGAFIIPIEFITPEVTTRITYWQSQGVVGVYTNAPIIVPVHTTITSFPLVMIDSLSGNQAIIETYYSNARIPASAYSLGSPAALTQCYDVWANPHGDPTWATHSYLYDFVTVQKSWIWAQCHSVSMMEYCLNGSQQLNFLSTNGLRCWGSGKCATCPQTHFKTASSPYTYNYPADPVMQFLGNAHGASSGGSEQWYQPLSTGQWNANTRRGISTGSGSSPGEGTVLVYGPAFNNPANGWAMYQGGHDLSSGGSSSQDRIAAQRAYFNYILLAGKTKKVAVTATIPSTLNGTQTANVSAIASSGTPPYTYHWTSSLGGSFVNANDSATIYISPSVSQDTMDVVQITVTDQCGRTNLYYRYITVSVSPLPVELLSFSAFKKEQGVLLHWSTASETNNDYFSIERSSNGDLWTLLGKVKGSGNSSVTNEYSFMDREPLKTISYYRLSQTDYDGKSEGFRVIRLNPEQSPNPKPGILNVSPNPFSESFNIDLNYNFDEEASLSLFDSQGELILRKNYQLKNGNNKLFFSDNGLLSEGIYFIVIKTKDGRFLNTKIVKR